MMSFCPKCHVHNACDCAACIRRNGITGREQIGQRDTGLIACWRCGFVALIDEWDHEDYKRWRVGVTFGIFKDPPEPKLREVVLL